MSTVQKTKIVFVSIFNSKCLGLFFDIERNERRSKPENNSFILKRNICYWNKNQIPGFVS